MPPQKNTFWAVGKCSMLLESQMSGMEIASEMTVASMNFTPTTRFNPGGEADDPEAFAFQRKLRDETRGQRGEVQRARSEVHETDELGKIIATKPASRKQRGELFCEKPEVQNVNAENTKEDERLAPLRGVAPEDADILEHNGAHIR